MRGRIDRLPAGDIRSQFIRLGLVEGAVVSCLEKLPGGTIVLEFSRQEVALSGDLARSITITQP
jgi:Fe2+ transport system protein FeoA